MAQDHPRNPKMALKRSSSRDCIVGLTQDKLDGMRGSYNECGTPTPEETEQVEGWTKYAWTVEGSVDVYRIHVSVPDNWDDVWHCSADLLIECSCPDAERQAQKNSRTRQIESPQYCKHVYKCLSGLVEKDQPPKTKRRTAGGSASQGKSFDERLQDYNAEVGAMIMFETRAKTARGGPCKVLGFPHPTSPPSVFSSQAYFFKGRKKRKGIPFPHPGIRRWWCNRFCV